MAAQYPGNIEKSIQTWVELDNELKKINDKAKDVRTRKNDLEDKIMDYVQENDMNNNFMSIPVVKVIQNDGVQLFFNVVDDTSKNLVIDIIRGVAND